MRFSITFIIFSLSNATIINVPQDYDTIQEGIDVSINGDTVLVDEGVYNENITLSINTNITLASHFIIDGDESHIGNTIITKEMNISPNLDSNSLISGFSFVTDDYNGDGIRFNIFSNPVISNNIFRSEVEWPYTLYGIRCNLAAPTIRNNLIYKSL